MASSKKPFHQIEQHLASQIHKAGLKGSKLLLAISGGKDSMALFHSFQQVAPYFQIHFCVGHFHHGQTDESPKTRLFRDKALSFIQDKCHQNSIPFHKHVHQGKKLTSEHDLRTSRWLFLKETSVRLKCKAIVTAHHRDDLLETRLLRLIRGVGLQGLMAMPSFDGQIFRPFLDIFQKDLLLAYPRLEFLEDPSNTSLHNLRNWIRHKWLVDLEEKSPGAKKALLRSLEILSQQKPEFPIEDFLEGDGIKRMDLERLSQNQARQVIATYLCRKQLENYKTSHIFEIQKRLKSPEKNFEFWLVKHKWIVTPTHIKVLKT